MDSSFQWNVRGNEEWKGNCTNVHLGCVPPVYIGTCWSMQRLLRSTEPNTGHF